uniref:Uncharacterized protein n=1 Tax=Lepeophtheirus salmonis TaxID=72036 RepID=A0A0K2U9Z2_LEPSM
MSKAASRKLNNVSSLLGVTGGHQKSHH